MSAHITFESPEFINEAKIRCYSTCLCISYYDVPLVCAVVVDRGENVADFCEGDFC